MLFLLKGTVDVMLSDLPLLRGKTDLPLKALSEQDCMIDKLSFFLQVDYFQSWFLSA